MRVDVHLISRSDPNQVVCITNEGESLTRLEDLRRARYPIIRTDIALVNVEREGVDHKQYAVYAGKDGQPHGDGYHWLNLEQRRFVQDENIRLIQVARKHPEFKVYLH